MLDFISKGITKIVGSKSDRDLKALNPFVPKINEEYAKLSSISDDALRNKTAELKQEIAKGLKSVDDKIAAIRVKIDTDTSLDIHQKDDLFAQIDNLEDDRNTELEVILLKILPTAFAVVKETARRLTENGNLTVSASMMDKQLAADREHITIDGEKAIWSNKWKAAGVEVEWNMVHYDVQLIGGVVLHQGKVAEMATGEGKTLVATLPAYLNALAERGVHVVTVNDYLANRDSEWMAPIFQFHGMTIDCIDKYRPHTEERRQAYNNDITYGTNNEFGFDYLRDNMSHKPDELVQRKHHFAMVDEVDSVLIDDARTPLIISGPVPKGDDQEYAELRPRLGRLVDAQRKLASNFLNEAKKLLKEDNEKEGGLALFRAYRALPKNKPLIKFLGESGMQALLKKTENIYIAEHQKLMPEADAPLLFTIDEQSNSVDLTDQGIDMLTGEDTDAKFFILPDISIELEAIDNDETKSLEERSKIKDGLIEDYTKKTQRIHSVNQLLKAYALFEKDVDYVVMDNKVKIVDEQTGRIMEGRRYSDGLHQALEAKENVKVEDATQTYATVTLQNYFRMYHKLCGMTGTAETEAGELWEIYELDVVVIPTNRNIIRDDRHDLVYKTVREKFNAVIAEVEELTKAGRPVLVGTTSVEISEVLSRALKMRQINHQVLNAKQHGKEADVVAEAGKPGTVTIATNMAGRGTDIKLSPESKAAGGLAIIGTERHESRRVDRQLRGRAGRQGDVGSSQFFVSLEDNLMRLFGSDRISKIMDRLGLKEGEVIQHSMISKSIERAQKKVEENNFGIRKRLLEYDDVMNAQREVVYKRRRNALYGERLDLDILTSLYERSEELANSFKVAGDIDSLRMDIISSYGYTSSLKDDEISKSSAVQLADAIYDEANAFYTKKKHQMASTVLPVLKEINFNKGETVQNVVFPLTDGTKQMQVTVNLEEAIKTDGRAVADQIQKSAAQAFIDASWTDHLRTMDDLKQNVRNASYEQKDPLITYKFEGFNLFKSLISKINEETTTFLLKATVPVQSSNQVKESREIQTPTKSLNENKDDMGSLLGGGGKANTDTQTAPPAAAPATSEKVAGRNDRVTVQYVDGTVRTDVKFKTVEQDVRNNKCVLVDSE